MQENLRKILESILEIQELDMQMLQLLRLKKERDAELHKIRFSQDTLRKQVVVKEQEIIELKKNIRLAEGELAEIAAKFKKLESQQHAIKKVEEFNALNHEMAQAERERVSKEQRLSELYDKLANEESVLTTFSQALETTVANNTAIEAEIIEAVKNINVEGRTIKKQRDDLVHKADPEIFGIYERLLKNKRDRVIVPIENRSCSGCHIMVTAQDENMVRKGERIVFCEHCSRIHFWPETEAAPEGAAVAGTRTRRRRSTAKA